MVMELVGIPTCADQQIYFSRLVIVIETQEALKFLNNQAQKQREPGITLEASFFVPRFQKLLLTPTK